MRSMVIFVWMMAIFIFTCTASFHELISSGVVRFHWDGHPRFSEFLVPYHLNGRLLLQKLGHSVVFQILTHLLLIKFKSKSTALIISASFAALTEVLQLYFTRGGRIFDIGFDLVGVFIAIGMASLFWNNQSKSFNVNKKPFY
ncbi:VanZ family protein [Neobacillus vireti]|uniref:VanZ family protein n=1 Tax=Neobacillus vireti TaxID=220686 RepID=UPI0030003924